MNSKEFEELCARLEATMMDALAKSEYFECASIAMLNANLETVPVDGQDIGALKTSMIFKVREMK